MTFLRMLKQTFKGTTFVRGRIASGLLSWRPVWSLYDAGGVFYNRHSNVPEDLMAFTVSSVLLFKDLPRCGCIALCGGFIPRQ